MRVREVTPLGEWDKGKERRERGVKMSKTVEKEGAMRVLTKL